MQSKWDFERSRFSTNAQQIFIRFGRSQCIGPSDNVVRFTWCACVYVFTIKFNSQRGFQFHNISISRMESTLSIFFGWLSSHFCRAYLFVSRSLFPLIVIASLSSIFACFSLIPFTFVPCHWIRPLFVLLSFRVHLKMCKIFSILIQDRMHAERFYAASSYSDYICTRALCWFNLLFFSYIYCLVTVFVIVLDIT